MELIYIDGSPFARMLRILVLEHDCPASLREITEFPPSDELFRLNTMGQAPVLSIGGGDRQSRHWSRGSRCAPASGPRRPARMF